MSRIGRKPINIPAGVTASVDNGVITVKGPKGTLDFKFNPAMTVEIKGDVIEVTRPNDAKENRSLHGLTRTLIHNMVIGVTEGYSKTLEVNGVGYRVQKQGNKCVMNLGYSHQVIVEDTEDIKIESYSCPLIWGEYSRRLLCIQDQRNCSWRWHQIICRRWFPSVYDRTFIPK